MVLKDKKIVVVVTGGIAAYKVPGLIRLLIKDGAEVRVTMTPSAKEFVTPNTLEVLTKYPVYTEEEDYPEVIGHIALADWADLAVVVPATANTLAKMAYGIGDNRATSFLLAFDGPILIAPAMNDKMWQDSATQENCQKLQDRGCRFIGPDRGFLAEGYSGMGRMAEPEAIENAVQALAALMNTGQLDLSGERVVVSAGGTVEAIDPVRYISNRSSGKMGFALAYVALMAGADVTLVRTASTKTLTPAPNMRVYAVDSAQDMYEVMVDVNHEASILIMAAAVSDYRVEHPAAQKIKKSTEGEDQSLTLTLVENPDILANLDSDTTYLVGFAAETEDVKTHAKEKLEKKGIQMIVANDVSEEGVGFESEDNAVDILTENGEKKIDKQSKFDVAAHILKAVMADKEKK